MSGSTLGGGTNSSVPNPLYYVSTTTPGYTLASSIISSIVSQFTSSQVLTQSTSGTAVATSSTPVLNVSTSLSTVTAANFSAIVDSSSDPVYIYASSTVSGGVSIVAGSGGGTIKVTANADGSATNSTVAVGDGNYWISNTSNTGNIDIATGQGYDTVVALYGNSTINAGAGANDLINLYSGNSQVLLSSGSDTIIAGVAGNTNTIRGTDAGTQDNIIVTGDAANAVSITEHYAHISFTNGSLTSTILGGAGSTTINAGGTGAVVWYGEATNQQDMPASSTLTDSINDYSTTNDTLYGGAGSSIINAQGSTGDVTLVTGIGNATLTGGSGADTFKIEELGTGGTHTIVIQNFTSSDTLDFQGYSSTPTATSSADGITIYNLNDGTTLKVISADGVSSPTASQIHTSLT